MVSLNIVSATEALAAASSLRKPVVDDETPSEKVSANSHVVATILRCVQAVRALKTRGLPLGHWGRSLEAKVACRALPGSEGDF